MSQKPDPNETAGCELVWSDWDAESAGLDFEQGIGLTIGPRVWLSWAETVALHRWLGEMMENANVSNG